jgi:phage-related protein
VLAKIYFYKSTSGKEVVLDFINELDSKSTIKARNAIRLLFSEIKADSFLFTNIFIKKSKKTPGKEIETAIKRLDEFI